jgi:hypothetical protein
MGTDILRFYVEVVDDRIMHSDGDVNVPGGMVYCSCGYFPSSLGDGKDASNVLRSKLVLINWHLQIIRDLILTFKSC